MVETVVNWLKFTPQNLILEVWVCLAVLWAVVMIIGFVDVATSHLKGLSKALWIALIFLLPLMGLFSYCIFCLVKADYHMVDFLFRKRTFSSKKRPSQN